MAVAFRSSRTSGGAGGDGGGESVSFERALLSGLAPGGGLYLPDRIPPLPRGWREHSDLPSLAASLLAPWIGEPSGEELDSLLREALYFPVPVVPLARDRWVVELFHGPTLSFKDFGARVMARLMNRYLAGSGRSLTVLVATSGDTGSAVADGFAGLENLRVVLLYPKGKVSEVQERQLTARRPGVHALAVRGDFDDCQRMVKEAFADPALAHVPLSSANSINVGRLLPQQLYYVWAVARLQQQFGSRSDDPVVSVPSGNLGNLTAGLLAAAGGLPVGRFIAAHNANDYFPSYLNGNADAFEFRPTRHTLSNAMDVGAPSNFERLHALFPDLGERVHPESVDDDATRERMRRVHREDGYVACPHTAVGLEAIERYRAATGSTAPALALATAHPAKFPGVVAGALGIEPPRSETLDELLNARASALELGAACEDLRQVLLGLD